MEKTPKSIPLEKALGSYKLIIPQEVEKKIRHLCSKISQVEWSGTLFYTYTGSYEENNLEIRCVDIFPMDIGTQTYTEFDMSPDVISYMTSHPELLDCQMGLIHSHNNMATFFSGTDTATLQEEGKDRNHFVSLIVNNAGSYTAAITRKLNIKKLVTSTYTYRTFDDLEKTGEKTVEVREEMIEYHMLTITKEGEVSNSFQEIDERLKEIKESKKKVVTKPPVPTTPYKGNDWTSRPYYSQGPTYQASVGRQRALFDDIDILESEPPSFYREDKPIDPNPNICIDASVVRSLTLQLITGSIAIADASRIDPTKWAGQMTALFDKRFDKDKALFDLWIEEFAEFILTNFIPEEYGYSEEEYVSELSSAIYMTLDKLPSNKYIKSIQDTLITWMK